MVHSRRSAGIAAAALVMVIIAGGCVRGQDDTAGCSELQAATAPSATGAATSPGRQDDRTAVCAAFSAYRKALEDRDAPAALALVPDSTIAYNDWIAGVAATAGPEEIGTLSMFDRMSVAALRLQFSTAELAAMDGRQLFSAEVETPDLRSSPLPSDDELGAVRIEGDRAYIQIVADGTPTPFDFELVRVDGAWLVDVVALQRFVNSVLEDGARRSGIPEDKLIFDSVEKVTGKQVDESIFARP
jgi:hypothetical protein